MTTKKQIVKLEDYFGHYPPFRTPIGSSVYVRVKGKFRKIGRIINISKRGGILTIKNIKGKREEYDLTKQAWRKFFITHTGKEIIRR